MKNLIFCKSKHFIRFTNRLLLTTFQMKRFFSRIKWFHFHSSSHLPSGSIVFSLNLGSVGTFNEWFHFKGSSLSLAEALLEINGHVWSGMLCSHGECPSIAVWFMDSRHCVSCNFRGGLFFLVKIEFLNSEINNSSLVILYRIKRKERTESMPDALLWIIYCTIYLN